LGEFALLATRPGVVIYSRCWGWALVAGNQLGGQKVGSGALALLAVDPLYLQSLRCQAKGPRQRALALRHPLGRAP
jgi:hypothetical protein